MYEIVANGKTLEIGGGGRRLHISITNIDVRALPSVDLVHDLNVFPWPVADEEYDMVIGIYVIEHVSWVIFSSFIKEIQRILRPGGNAVFLTSNLEAQAKRIIREGCNYKTIECIFGSQDYKENSHSMGFSPSFAKTLFKDFKVKAIAPMPDIVFTLLPDINKVGLYPGSETDMVIELTKPIPVPVTHSGQYGVKGLSEFVKVAPEVDKSIRITDIKRW